MYYIRSINYIRFTHMRREKRANITKRGRAYTVHVTIFLGWRSKHFFFERASRLKKFLARYYCTSTLSIVDVVFRFAVARDEYEIIQGGRCTRAVNVCVTATSTRITDEWEPIGWIQCKKITAKIVAATTHSCKITKLL